MSHNSGRRKESLTQGSVVGVAFTLLTIGGAVLLAGMSHEDRHADPGSTTSGLASAATPLDTTWTVGELRANGLRIMPSGRNDAANVLDPPRFADADVRTAYEIATQIPEILNQLYCWCGCENRGVHRSNLGCFEDEMGVNCDVCRGTAEIAWEMVGDGVTDPGEIQAAVDAEWAPPGARGA